MVLSLYNYLAVQMYYNFINVLACFVKGCLHVRFCALRLTSWSMCLTKQSIEEKLQRNHERIFCSIDYHEFITYARLTITTSKIANVNSPLNRWNGQVHSHLKSMVCCSALYYIALLHCISIYLHSLRSIIFQSAVTATPEQN